MSMGGGDEEKITEIRYAPYIEAAHHNFLNIIANYRMLHVDFPPGTGYEDVEVEDAFFGSGYAIANFPSLYDMYGKFMAGLDIEVLWSQNFEHTVNPPEVSNLVSAEAELLDDDIEIRVLPRFQVGMRDINSVMSSSYVIGKAIIEDARVKALSKYSAELKYRLIPVAEDRWARHLEWNKAVVTTYAEIMKLYYIAKIDVDEVNYAMAARNKLWPFTVLEYERAAIAAMQGATTTTTTTEGSSTATKLLSGALGGAAMGSEIATGLGIASGGIGAAAGALIGFGAGFL